MLIRTCVVVMLGLGCGKGEKAPDKEAPKPSAPTKPEVGSTTPTASKVETVKPVAESPNAKRCKDLLAKSWKAAQPGFAKLQVAVDGDLEKVYTGNESYVQACGKLAADKLECLEKAENPITGLDTCKVNEGAAESLALVSVQDRIGVDLRKPLSKEEGDKVLASIEGTWVNEWPALKEQTTWTIGKAGAVTAAEVLKEGKPKDKASIPDQLAVDQEARIKAHWKDSNSTQTLSFFKNGNELYASANSLYDAYQVPDQKKFVVRFDWTYIAFEDGKCEAIDPNAVIVPATCSFATDKGNKVFRAEWQFPTDKSPRKSEHVVIGNYFVHKSMYEIARFKRK